MSRSMQEVRATRSELIALKKRIVLAERGCELLKDKRSALWTELRSTAAQVVRSSDEVEQSISKAVAALDLAMALDGPQAVQSAALAAQPQKSLEVSSVNVMGVTVPLIEQRDFIRGALDRGYSLMSVSGRIDAAAEAYEVHLKVVTELAASEMRLRCLAEEIHRTTRLVNALESVVIPRLKSQSKWIQLALEERWRSDLSRFKRFKTKLQRRNSLGSLR